MKSQPKEYKVVALRECPLPEEMQICDTPERAADYWNTHVVTTPNYDPDCECFVVLFLNTRHRIKGHHFVSIGTLDSLIVRPGQVFKTAILVSAASLILMHNHPSGQADPSEADIKITRDLIRAGQLLKIEILDHVIVGASRHLSLKTLGYFF